MGGLPCYKEIIDGRLQAMLYALICESQIVTNNLAVKNYDVSPILEDIVKWEEEMCRLLEGKLDEFKKLNNAYAVE